MKIGRLRRLRWTGTQIAPLVGVSVATVARTLGQLGLARLSALTLREAPRRYAWPRPGQLLHVDTKKLGRIAGIGHRITGDRRQRARGIGWEFTHVCIDDCSRLAYGEVCPTSGPAPWWGSCVGPWGGFAGGGSRPSAS